MDAATPLPLSGRDPDALRGDRIAGEQYFSREFAQAEWDRLWTRIWHIAGLVALIDAGTLLPNAAKEVFVEMFASGEQPAAVVERKGLKAAPVNVDELEQWCRDAIAGNAKAVAEFKSGKDSAINALKGPVMKAAKGKADPKRVDETLRKLLGSM